MNQNNRSSASSTGNLPTQTTGSTPSSPERAAHREWIGGRALTLLSHYYRPDDPVELTAAIGQDWADVLEGIPREFIQRAAIQYQREEPRKKPTPGAIYGLAQRMMPKPQTVREPEPERVPATPEEAAKILDEIGFNIRRFGA